MLIPLDGPSITVEMIPCKSTMLESFGYDPKSRTLYVRFLHGHRLYQYPGVPEDMFGLMKKAPSPGKYFNASIIKGGYEGKYIKEVA
jgi:KTSC domain